MELCLFHLLIVECLCCARLLANCAPLRLYVLLFVSEIAAASAWANRFAELNSEL